MNKDLGLHEPVGRLLGRLCPACRSNVERDFAGEEVRCDHLVRCRDWRTHGRCKECGVATEHVARLLEWARKITTTVLPRDREVEAFAKEADEVLRRLREGSVLPRGEDEK